MVACLGFDRHGKVEKYRCMPAPLAFNSVECAWLNALACILSYSHRCIVRPARNTQGERKPHRLFSDYREPNVFFEGIVSAHFNTYRSTGSTGGDNTGSIHKCCKTMIGGAHPKMCGEFGPALLHIGGTAAKVWCKSEDICLRSICCKHTVF